MHHAADNSHQGRLRLALVLTALFFVAEVVGGLVSNSLALLADAGHMFTDVGALSLSLFVAWFSRQPSAPEKTYGYLRWEVLAAFLNGSVLLLVSAAIVWEALGRLRAPEPLEGGVMLAVALGGLVVNVLSAWILRPVHRLSLNTRGAYLHVMADAVTSLLAIAALLAGKYMGATWLDPAMGIVGAVLVARWSYGLIGESSRVLLDRQADEGNIAALRKSIEARASDRVTDLHIWSIGHGIYAAEIAVVSDDPATPEYYKSLIPGTLNVVHATVEAHKCRRD